MKLLLLTLNNFKNLNDFKIEFSEDTNNNSLLFFLGNNGSGKTTVFEAILTIFASFYSPTLLKNSLFEYEICYEIRDSKIYLKRKKISENEYTYVCKKDEFEEKFDNFNDYRKKIISNENEYIPQIIVTSYSGINDRIKPIYKNIQKNYKRNLNRFNINYMNNEDKNNKRFIHSIDESIFLYIPAVWLGDNAMKNILKNNCNIDKIEEIIIKINLTFQNVKKILPEYEISKYTEDKKKIQDKLTNDPCNFEFLNTLNYFKALDYRNKSEQNDIFSNDIFINKSERKESENNGSSGMENLHIKNLKDLEERKRREFAILKIFKNNYVINSKNEMMKRIPEGIDIWDKYSTDKNRSHSIKLEMCLDKIKFNGIEVFEFLHDLKQQYDAIIDVKLKKNNYDDSISATNLSEGECQLIKVLGMLVLAQNKEGIVLLDEPDVHMNPKWKYNFRKMIDKLLKNLQGVQVIINTHDPLMINGAMAEEVRIFEKFDKQILVNQPFMDATGKSIDGLLKSQYFNLEETLDYKTKQKITKREELYREYNESLSKGYEDRGIKKELEEINKEIAKLPFTNYDYIDKSYREYLSIIKELSLDIDLTKLDKDEMKSRKEKLKSIVQKVINDEIF